MGKDKCERKAYLHKACPDRNRIWLRVNSALESKFLIITYLVKKIMKSYHATCEQDRKSIQVLVNAIPIR